MTDYTRKCDGWFSGGKNIDVRRLPERHRQVLATVDASGVFDMAITQDRLELADRLTMALRGDVPKSVFVFHAVPRVFIEE